MKNFPILFLLLLFVISSCNQISALFEQDPDDPYLLETYHKNGNIKTEINIDSARNRHGLSLQYFNSGKLKTEINYSHGVKQKAIQYYENGNKYVEFFYNDGKKHGKRTKYWENGRVQSTLEYNNGNPMPGLVEYKSNGQQLTKYPTLNIERIDQLNTTGKYSIEIYFSSNPGRGTYYLGKLRDGALPKNLEKLKKVNRRGRITYSPYPGTFFMRKLNIIGRYKTPFGNPYIVKKTINVAIDF